MESGREKTAIVGRGVRHVRDKEGIEWCSLGWISEEERVK